MKGQNHFTFRDLVTDKGNRFIILALTIIPLLIFWQTISFEFLWDDIDIHIIDNPFLNPPSAENLSHFWKEVYMGLYIPVAYCFWAFIKILSSLIALKPVDATLFHLANIILHTLNGVLVFALLRQLIQNKWAAFAGSLLFLIHPIQVESVAWVSEFRGLLAAFFCFLALLCYLKSIYLENGGGNLKRSWMYYLLSFGLFIFALFSKPSAVVLPLFMAILDFTIFHSSIKRIASRLWIWILPVLIVFLITASIQDNIQSTPLWARPLIFLDSFTFYLYKFLLPVNLSGCYALTPTYLIAHWWFYVICIVPAIIISGLWLLPKKASLLITASLIFVAGFLPVSGLISFTFQDWSTVADRYLYLSVFGVSLALADLAERYLLLKRSGIIALITILVIWTSVTAFIQVPIWKNQVTFWSHVIKNSPAIPKAYYNRGLALIRISKEESAIEDFTKAINTGFTGAYNNRGGAYIKTGEYQKAIDDLDKAISINPKNVLAYYNRGGAYLKLRKYDLSVADFDRVLVMNPHFEKTQHYRLIAISKLKNTDSVSYENKAVPTSNNITDKQNKSLYNVGNSLAEKAKYALAIHYYSQAITQNPSFEEAYTNRGNCYSELKDYKKAIQDYKKVLELNSSSVIILNNIAIAYYSLGNKEKACEYWKKGKDLKDAESEKAFRLHCK